MIAIPAGERGFHLAGRTGDFDPALPALPELVGVSEAGGVEQILDIAGMRRCPASSAALRSAWWRAR